MNEPARPKRKCRGCGYKRPLFWCNALEGLYFAYKYRVENVESGVAWMCMPCWDDHGVLNIKKW